MNHHDHVNNKKALLLIDGDCNLCHWMTRFVIKRDTAEYFQFASLQSDLGRTMLERGDLMSEELNTFVMVQDDCYYTQSEAALRVVRKLNGLWPLLYGFIIFPKPIRDWFYKLIARRRYRWFGRTEYCLLPTPELRSRFVDDTEQQAK